MKNMSFFGDKEIESMLHVGKGVIGKITGSFLVSYKKTDSGDKMVVDIGLNCKNMTKKQHVPKFVRYIAGSDTSANDKHDGF